MESALSTNNRVETAHLERINPRSVTLRSAAPNRPAPQESAPRAPGRSVAIGGYQRLPAWLACPWERDAEGMILVERAVVADEWGGRSG